MRVVASGYVFDARDAPHEQRSCAFTSVTLTRDGTLLVTFRRGSQRESVDGHECVFASLDSGDTWELRYDGAGRGAWDGIPGEVKTLLIAETAAGELFGAGLWVDRSGLPRPFVNPQTQGLLPMRVFHTISRDGGRTWGSRRSMETQPHHGASPTGPPLLLWDGGLAQPYEHWKDYEDTSPAWPGAELRLSHDGGATWSQYVTVAAHSENARFYWDQRLAAHPDTGALVAMFWTHDPLVGQDVNVHASWGTPDGRVWSAPVGIGLPGQHCQPIPVGGDRLVAVYAHRRNPAGIRAALSHDFGRTWDHSKEVAIYDSAVGTEPGSTGPRALGDYWDDMINWHFGHPRGVLLASGEVFVVFYAGDDRRASARWARLTL